MSVNSCIKTKFMFRPTLTVNAIYATVTDPQGVDNWSSNEASCPTCGMFMLICHLIRIRTPQDILDPGDSN